MRCGYSIIAVPISSAIDLGAVHGNTAIRPLTQRRIASLLRQGMSQVQVAKKLDIAKQVVSRQVLASGCIQYIAAENAWRMILQNQVDPLLGSKHGLSRRH